MNKTEQVANYLKEKGTITSWFAIQKFKATRLSAIIFNLRDRGWDIETNMVENIDVNGNVERYGVYTLKGIKDGFQTSQSNRNCE